MLSNKTVALLVAVCVAQAVSFTISPAPFAFRPATAVQKIGTFGRESAAVSQKGKTAVAVSTRDEASSLQDQAAKIPEFSVTKSKADKVRDVQNGAFIIGSVVTIASIVLFYATDRNGELAGPPFKLGSAIFFLGVTLQYAETYNKCTYIRFVREGLLNPKSIVRRWKAIMFKVDGDLFRFFLPGRSYDVIDGKPVLRSERAKKE
eukprot:CAMPEP_0196730920 /NCGR_PEP_ID=MMETSP1091-20130531/10835_1 /TAXON_ID=302021 /ORGANISM="Rhodomonas sp., Strain CCMP768" /LENGTH=204 /DNA_ID=CAMNT_0042074007 /DNA_START=1 /DNA_END=615 /DNA_ORIENTATION=+